jgi:hypothetical protein
VKQLEVNKEKGGKRAAQWLLTVLLVSAVLLSSFSTVDRYAEQEYENLFQRALITFALARALNGVISAVQGTELALQPAGVGVTLTPGEVLDPVNDLVERFSWIMLGATLSLGVQQVLLDIGQWWGIRVLLALFCLGWLWFRWRQERAGKGEDRQLGRYLLKALVLVLFLRFAVPLTIIANEVVYSVFLESRYQESTQVIESAGAQIERATESDGGVGEVDEGILDSIGRTFNSARQSLDFQQRLSYISERASDVIEHLLQLGVVFIFQAGILPIVFLWIFLRLFQQLFRNKY